GYRVVVNGSEGRAELDVVERSWVEASGAVVDPSANPVEQAERTRPVGERLVVQRHWEPPREVEIPAGKGGHGGGDAFLLQDIFEPGTREDPLGQAAGLLAAVRAACVGIAGNGSLVSGETGGGEGGQGGGAALLLQDICEPGTGEGPLGQAAGVLDGVGAVCVGIAGHGSLVSGQAVRIADLDLGVDPAARELT